MITGFVILLAGAAVGVGLARLLRLPTIPMLLAVGFVMSLMGLMPATEILGNFLVLGVSFLLFAAGVELDVHRVGRYRRAAIRVGLVQFVVLTAVGLLTALVLGFALLASFYLALAVAASSTLVVVRILQQQRQMFEPFGRMVLGVLLLQDLLVIVAAPVLIRIAEGVLAAAIGLGFTLLLIGLAYALQRWIIPHLILRQKLEGESLLLLTLAMLFGFIGLSFVLDLPMITGAFLAGFALSSFPISGLVREQLTPLTDFFLSLFFIALGGFIILPGLSAGIVVGTFILVVIVVTVPLVTLVAEQAGFSARAAIESGLLLAQTSELSIIIGLLAFTAGVINEALFSVIVLVTVITMIITPFLATRRVVNALLRLHPARVRERPEAPPADHILLLGVGRSGMPLLETLFLAGYDVLVVDEDPAQVDTLQEEGIPAIRGDGADREVLRAAGIGQARVIISMMRPADSLVLLEEPVTPPVFARVFTDEDAEAVEGRGGIPIRYADVAADAFLNWFERVIEKDGRP